MDARWVQKTGQAARDVLLNHTAEICSMRRCDLL
jgi:hypothetical protein